MLSFSIEILAFSIETLSFSIRILSFSIEIMSFSIEILVFSIKILSFSIEIFTFSIVFLVFSIEKMTFFSVFVLLSGVYLDFSAQIWTRLTNVSVVFSRPLREFHSSLPWKLCPPVNRFGVGRPLAVRFEPSVPPRIGRSSEGTPARFAASIA